MANKITKRTVINAMIAFFDNMNTDDILDGGIFVEDGLNYLNNELKLLDNKSSKRKSSKDSEVNKKVREGILSILSTSSAEGMLASEILVNGIKAGVFDDTVTTSRITSVLGYLQDDKVVIRTTKGKKALFTLA